MLNLVVFCYISLRFNLGDRGEAAAAAWLNQKNKHFLIIYSYAMGGTVGQYGEGGGGRSPCRSLINKTNDSPSGRHTGAAGKEHVCECVCERGENGRKRKAHVRGGGGMRRRGRVPCRVADSWARAVANADAAA